MIKVTDQMGHQLELSHPPQRIVSLVPSQTELLFELGLADRIAGITKFCIHPRQQVKGKQIVGGTKNFHLEVIRALQPDLIIGNKEENEQAGIRALQQHYPVWMSDISNLAQALEMIMAIGYLTDTAAKAALLSQQIQKGFEALKPPARIPAAYFIWQDPFMVVGKDCFIEDMLSRAGFINVFQHLARYPQVSSEDIRQANPRVILLSSEPYPFRAKHLAVFQELCPQAQVRLVDGELFSWYGSRLRLTPAYLQQVNTEAATAQGITPRLPLS